MSKEDGPRTRCSNYAALTLLIPPLASLFKDIVEMNIRLTYSESHVPNWLLQQVSGHTHFSPLSHTDGTHARKATRTVLRAAGAHEPRRRARAIRP